MVLDETAMLALTGAPRSSAAAVLLLLLAGVAAGVVNGVAGGGTLLSFPALLALGLSPVLTNVTNTVGIWPGYLSGALSYRGELSRDWARHRLLAGVSGAGGAVGAVLLLTAPATVFHLLVPFLVLAATALLAAQPVISRVLARRRRPRRGRRGSVLVLAGVFGAAVYGAYFGGGLGIILFAVLALGVDSDLQLINGLKTLLAMVINTVALLGFAAFGPVDWAAVALVAPASFLGGVLGAKAAKRLDPRLLRVGVVLLGCVVGARLLVA
jgi:uncharacterized membrane protein YfcA